jgi:uncharacterized protein (TIGR03000 family)
VYSVIFLAALGAGPELAAGQRVNHEGNIPVPPPANSPFTPAASAASYSSPVEVYVTRPAAPPRVVYVPVEYVPAPQPAPAPATVRVRLPADARLTIDGGPTTSTGGTRLFASPPLAPGQTYYYTLSAEVRRDGRRLTVTRRVAVRAGRDSAVELTPTTFTVAGK